MAMIDEKGLTGLSSASLRAVPAARVDLHPGDRFAERYVVERLLGRGGMGEVWLATQEPLGRRVAVKVLRPPDQIEDDPNFDQRFLREAAASSRLAHPHVVTVYDFGQSKEGALYIVMEHLDGKDLRTVLSHTGAFPPLRALHISRQVARALRDAHSHGIIHRDLKPANVFLLHRDDDPDFVKVLDFGLVKFADEVSDITLAGRFLGSPRWTSPEALDRRRDVDHRADIYALGLLLYSMLVGAPPFDGDPVQVMHAHLHDRPPPMALRNPRGGIIPEVEAVVARCLEKDPDRRFAGMEDLLRALREVTASYGGDDTGTVEIREPDEESLELLEDSADRREMEPIQATLPSTPRAAARPSIPAQTSMRSVPTPLVPSAGAPQVAVPPPPPPPTTVVALKSLPASRFPWGAAAPMALGAAGLLWLLFPGAGEAPSASSPDSGLSPAPSVAPSFRIETEPPGAALSLRQGDAWIPLGNSPWEGPLPAGTQEAEVRALLPGFVEWSDVVLPEEGRWLVKARLLPEATIPSEVATPAREPTPRPQVVREATPVFPPPGEPTPAPVPAGYKEDPY